MSEEKELTVYDATEYYENTIKPMVAEIKKLCKVNRIPFVFSIAIKNDAKKTRYIHESNLTGSNGIILKDDRFEQYLGALCGFNMVPRSMFNKHFDEDALSDELPDEAMDYLSNNGDVDDEFGGIIDINAFIASKSNNSDKDCETT